MTCNPLTATCAAPYSSQPEAPAEEAVSTPAAAPARIVLPPWIHAGRVDLIAAFGLEIPAAPPAALAAPSCTGARIGARTSQWRTGNVSAVLGFNPNNAASLRQMQAALHVPQTGTMTPATARALNALVRAIQQDLVSRLHCDVGNIDGILGPLTLAAMQTHLGGRTLMSFASAGTCE